MVSTEPKGPYVSQPYGSITHPDRAQTGRLYGVSGVDLHTEITGLTKEEAQAVCDALNEQRRFKEGYYNEAADGWARVRKLERALNFAADMLDAALSDLEALADLRNPGPVAGPAYRQIDKVKLAAQEARAALGECARDD